MTLQELVTRHGTRAAHSVPDWMLGFWKRYSISFANGMTDLSTHVCWVQSRNFTIDLRLPLERDQIPARRWHEYSTDELQALANYEGWAADSVWDGTQLAWRDTEVSLQVHNRWPEPAILKRTGNCMIEHCPSNIYVEDWRLQSSAAGPLIGLRLLEERSLADGRVRHRGGGLIVCGDYAALALGRPSPLADDVQFKQQVAVAGNDAVILDELFAFEVSVAVGAPNGSYHTMLSTCPARVGTALFASDGFSYCADTRQVRHCFERDGLAYERLFAIDALEVECTFAPATPTPPRAQAWFAAEASTLGRYLEMLE